MNAIRDKKIVNLKDLEGKFGGGDWQKKLHRKADDSLLANLTNIATILQNDPATAGLYRMNSFANRVERTREAPYITTGDEFRDVEGTKLTMWLEQNYSLKVKTGMVMEAVVAVADDHHFHPVRDYLESLQWDGKKRIPGFFDAYFGAKNGTAEYRIAAARSMFVSAVARIINPGCKADTMIVLIGAQGAGKSESVIQLFGLPHHAEVTETPGSKDFYQCLQGKWCAEFGELAAFRRADSERLKQALSQRTDTYRPSYGRLSATFPRQNVFVGTTNESEFNPDPTGGRRFFPITCRYASPKDIADDRDQLWAEAVTLYRAGADWWEVPDAAEEQEGVQITDPWEKPVLAYVSGRLKVTTEEILTDGLRLDMKDVTTAHTMRVGKILKNKAKWERKKFRTVDGGYEWAYMRPGVNV